jgi:hypothetical protein
LVARPAGASLFDGAGGFLADVDPWSTTIKASLEKGDTSAVTTLDVHQS